MIAPALPPAPERLPVATTDAHTHLASTATKTRLFDLGNNLSRISLSRKNFAECLISIMSNIFFNLIWINTTTISQCNTHLL